MINSFRVFDDLTRRSSGTGDPFAQDPNTPNRVCVPVGAEVSFCGSSTVAPVFSKPSAFRGEKGATAASSRGVVDPLFYRRRVVAGQPV
jgi:hypothetical protein